MRNQGWLNGLVYAPNALGGDRPRDELLKAADLIRVGLAGSLRGFELTTRTGEKQRLEQIDYAAYAANKELIGQALGQGDIRKFQRLAIACAQARAVWIAQALAASASGGKLSSADLAQLSHLRATFEELTEAYEGMRRLVERGYLQMPTPTPA